VAPRQTRCADCDTIGALFEIVNPVSKAASDFGAARVAIGLDHIKTFTQPYRTKNRLYPLKWDKGVHRQRLDALLRGAECVDPVRVNGSDTQSPPLEVGGSVISRAIAPYKGREEMGGRTYG
jgi:hypothetical protein